MRRALIPVFIAVLSLVCLTSCSPTDPVAEYNAALELIEKKDYPAALERAKKCVRMNREDIDAIKLQTLCAFSYDAEESERQSALQNLKRMVKSKAKEDYQAYFFLGWAFFQMYNHQAAQENLTEAYRLMPKEGMADSRTYHSLLYMIGLCCLQNNLPQGLEYLRPLEGISPYKEWPEYYMNYAMLAYRLKRYNEAIVWFNKAQRLDPTLPQPYLNIAIIYDTNYGATKYAKLWYTNALVHYQKQGNTLYSKKIQARLSALVRK
jgi:tetratricopeptide (TPR) repeat protein